MDIVDSWSIKIAEEAAPDEVDLAPAIAQAFVAGGKEREDLFRQAEEAELAGFGVCETIALLPWILKGLVTASSFILAMLAALPHINNFLLFVKNVLNLQKRPKIDIAQSLPDDPYAPLKRAIGALSNELQAVPISQNQRDLIVYHTLYALLKDPTGANQFVQKISEVPCE